MKRSRNIALITLSISIITALTWFATPPLLQWMRNSSGSRPAPESAGLSREEQQLRSEDRARTILAAINTYRAAHAKLPQSLDQLVPDFLPELPKPATTTLPFELLIKSPTAFQIRWEPHPNTTYERFWIDQDGNRAADL